MNIIDMEYDKEDMWKPDFEGKLSDEKKQMIKNIENLVYSELPRA